MAQNIHDGNGDDAGDGDLVMIMVMMVVVMMVMMVMMVVVMMVMVSRERAWNFGFLSEERFPSNTVAQEVIKRLFSKQRTTALQRAFNIDQISKIDLFQFPSAVVY